MTYYQEGWNLYVARFLMKKIVKDAFGKIVKETHYIDVQLFQFDNPEDAFNEIIEMTKSRTLSYANREEGNTIELSCIGLNDLDILQSNFEQIKETLETETYGIDLAIINLDEVKKDVSNLISKKEDLSLFDKYYNYKKK
jgi:hypothetical protein